MNINNQNKFTTTRAESQSLSALTNQRNGSSIKLTQEMITQSEEAKRTAEQERKIFDTKVRVSNVLGTYSGLSWSSYNLNYNKLNYFTPNSYSHSIEYSKTGEREAIFVPSRTHYALEVDAKGSNPYWELEQTRFGDNLSGISVGRGVYNMLNAAGKSQYLNTPFGEMQVFLDLDDDNDKYGVGNLDFMGQLINLDINQDGFLDSSDEFFDKLKLKGYNSAGEEVILKLNDVYNALDLSKFVNTQKDVGAWRQDRTYESNGILYGKPVVANGTHLFRPEESYKRLNEDSANKFKEMFKNNADESGWIDFTKTYKDKNGLEHLVYENLLDKLDLAYSKVGLNGESRLERLRFNGYDGRYGDNKAYLEDLKERFNKMYQDYYSKEGNTLAIQREFQVITGMKFSESKFKEFYEGLNNPATAMKYANALKDVDSVVAMKLNDNGMVTLKFNSGREISVDINDLWSSDGEFNVTDKGERASVMSEATSLNEEELNKLDFSEIGIDSNGSIVSLAELGVEFIRKETFSNGRSAFVLTTGSGKELVASTLYKIRSVEDMVKFAELEEKDKLRGSRFEMEM